MSDNKQPVRELAKSAANSLHSGSRQFTQALIPSECRSLGYLYSMLRLLQSPMTILGVDASLPD